MIWMLFIAIVVLSAFGLYRLRRVRQRARHEQRLQAIVQIGLLRQLLEQVQRHRGLSFGAMSGEHTLEARRWSVHQQLLQLLKVIAEHEATLYWYDSWHQTRDLWQQIEAGFEHESAEHLLTLHNSMTASLLDTIEALAHRFDLVCLGRLAPQAEGLWLELLQNIELIGQSRAVGTGIAANRQNLPVWRELLQSLSDQINDQAYAVLARLISDPDLRVLVSQPVRDAEDALDVLLENIRALLERQREPRVHSVEFFQLATRAISAQLLLVDLLLERLALANGAARSTSSPTEG
ncbi:hypothetical protein SAMN05216271_0283 [Halopseudomonas sabulinigri]|uniref:Nitrate/nitrite sensing protein domain-containing protein n=1 Tax=Halopseudomonas sabulinigri TaxID=472181 RepID=A0A1H1LLV1_9GAMM|nr:hypothetical protein [Halopseudomonas sabulinigri]SDR75330.1 hypothetical protein SAMN05216271_0283 [Halopseudomonas sabulinigri]